MAGLIIGNYYIRVEGWCYFYNVPKYLLLKSCKAIHNSFMKTTVQKVNLPQHNLLKDLRAWHTVLNKKYPKGTGNSEDILFEIRNQRHQNESE